VGFCIVRHYRVLMAIMFPLHASPGC
jgi:hypothetical protein